MLIVARGDRPAGTESLRYYRTHVRISSGRTLHAVECRLLGTGVELRLSSELLLGDNPLHERQLRAAEAAAEFVLVDAGTFAEIEVDGEVHRIGGAQSIGNQVELGADKTNWLCFAIQNEISNSF